MSAPNSRKTSDIAVLQLAANLLAVEPTPSFVDALQQPGIREALSAIEPSCADLLQRQWSESDHEDAAVEFCRLFLLNPAVPARAAAWLKEDTGDHSLLVAGRIQIWIDDQTLHLAPPFDSLPPDHAALLLSVVAHLASSNPAHAAEFARENLLPWLPRFLASLAENSKHPLYSLTSKLISGTISEMATASP